MRKNKEFDNILDECLERLLVRGGTIEQCLQSYPGHAAELEPLLRTVLTTKKASAIQPRSEFRAKARYQFQSLLQEATRRRSRSIVSWFPRWAVVGTIVLGLAMVGGGTVTAADYSMPDEPLYPVKLAAEQVQLTLTFSNLGKAELCAKLADRRVEEIIHMANKGNIRQVENITERMDKRLSMLAGLALTTRAGDVPKVMAPSPALSEEARGSKGVYAQTNKRANLKATVAHYAVTHPEALRAVLDKTPESARPALNRAIAVSIAGYERALKAMD